jgi:Arc/MetJ family transcription regulator
MVKAAGKGMARTRVVLDDKLVAECRNLRGIRTQRAPIDHTVPDLLRRERQKKVLELRGKVKWDGELAAWRKAGL